MTKSRGIYSKRVNGTLAERLFAKTRRAKNGCLEFTGCVHSMWGYGLLGNPAKTGRCMRAHRAAWIVAHGAIPSGLDVCHSCDNRKCVDVAHLFLGTRKDNMQDALCKGRLPRGERHGSAKLTDVQVALIRSDRGATPQRALAARFGVTQSNISRIVNRKSRK